MVTEREAQFNAAFHAAIATLERLQRAALNDRRAATFAESQQAMAQLIDALEFDSTEGQGLRPKGGRA